MQHKPVCSSCKQPLELHANSASWHCRTQKCVDYALSQNINDNVQPMSECGVPLYKHSGSCRNCMPEPKPEQAVKGTTGADTIKARESVYGPFAVHAKAEQEMKSAMTSQPGWHKLNDVQKSAAEMIVHKLARILNGSADYDDNWHDIAGYATLAEQDLKK